MPSPLGPVSPIDGLRDRLSREGLLVLDVKVVPRAAQSEVVGLLEDGTLAATCRSFQARLLSASESELAALSGSQVQPYRRRGVPDPDQA